MPRGVALVVFVVMATCLPYASASWGFSQEELEVFEVVDDFKGNFYEFLGIAQDAKTSDIRRAYRKLSMTMHPDKNKTEGAEENFRILVAINEILKDKERREIYDNVLANGLPSSYLYVPKRVRKMSTLEFLLFTTAVFTIGHFLCITARAWEKRLSLEEYMPKLRKKTKKRNKNAEDAEVDAQLEGIADRVAPWPTWRDSLPIVLPRTLYRIALAIPNIYRHQKRMKQLEEERAAHLIKQAEEERAYQQELKDKREEAKRIRKENLKKKREQEELETQQYEEEMRKQQPTVVVATQRELDEDGNPVPTLDDIDAMYDSDEDASDEYNTRKSKKKKNSKKEEQGWSADDQSRLCALMSRYPGGTHNRWAVIARDMDRDIATVTRQANLARAGLGKAMDVGGVVRQRRKQTQTFAHVQQQPAAGQDETTPDAKVTAVEEWTQKQQKILEQALVTYPKTEDERWEKIAAQVPGKNKTDCIERYRFLMNKIKEKRTAPKS